MHASPAFLKRLSGFGLTTAKVWYTKPDAPWLINPNWLVWQCDDVAPDFPVLHEFLNAWNTKLEGKPVFVRVAHSKLLKPAEIHAVDGVFRLH